MRRKIVHAGSRTLRGFPKRALRRSTQTFIRRRACYRRPVSSLAGTLPIG